MSEHHWYQMMLKLHHKLNQKHKYKKLLQMYLCFKQGFDIKKYCLLGKTLNEGEEHLKSEVIREIRVEVPIEIIKEVEKIVEVPVEKVVIQEIIKEVPVDRV